MGNPSLLQKENAMHSERRAQASKLLSNVAQKLQNPRLATLAVRVRLDAFTRVKKAIDDMVAQLLKEKEDEIRHKDFCVEEFNTNELQTEKKEREKSDLTAKIEDLELTIKQLTEAIDQLKAEVAEMQVQLKRAGEDREKENKEFQMTVADQRATQKLLTAALNILKGFYEKKAKAALLQTQQPAGPPPPPGFEAYKDWGGGKGKGWGGGKDWGGGKGKGKGHRKANPETTVWVGGLPENEASTERNKALQEHLKQAGNCKF